MIPFLSAIGTVVLALLIAGLGSGVWEWVQKPFLKWLGNQSSAWIKRGLDRTYAFTATRPIYEAQKASLHTRLLLTMGLLSLALTFARIGDFSPVKFLGLDSRARIEAFQKESATPEEFKARVDAHVRRMDSIVGVISILFSLTLFVSSLRKQALMEIVYDRIRDFDHAMAVVRPNISELEYHLLARDFACMRSRQDYNNLFARMNEMNTRRPVKNVIDEVDSTKPDAVVPV